VQKVGKQVKFDWQVKNGDGWREVRESPPRPARWLSRRRLVVISLVFVLVALGLILWYFVHGVERLAKDDLRAVVELEVQALRRADKEIFLSLQDTDDSTWYKRQQSYIDNILAEPSAKAWPGEVEIAAIEWFGDQAWVEVTHTWQGVTHKRVQFYRLADGQWKHTGPDERYWGQRRDMESEHLHFVYPERDEAMVKRLIDEGDQMYERICRDFGIGPSEWKLWVLIQPFSGSLFGYKAVDGPHVRLESPLLYGMRTDDWLSPWMRAQLARSLAIGLFIPGSMGDEVALRGTLPHAIVNWEVSRLVPDMPREPVACDQLGQAMEAGGLIPLEQVLWVRLYYGLRADLLEAEAETLLEYIVDEYGAERIPALWRGLRFAQPAEEMVLSLFGIGLKELEAGWIAFVEARCTEK
jgi:hypothetical protein